MGTSRSLERAVRAAISWIFSPIIVAAAVWVKT